MTRDDLTKLEEEYKEYAADCKAAMKIALARIQNIQEMLERSSNHSPFDSIEYRIKSFESTIEKLKDKGQELTIESIRENVRDIAGIRIVTIFKDEVMRAVEILEHIDGINIVERKDYISKPKDNGYQSYHLSTQIAILQLGGGTKLVPVEIQIRDKQMDLWATVEHVVGYKNENPSPEVQDLFLKLSSTLNEFDKVAMQLRDYS